MTTLSNVILPKSIVHEATDKKIDHIPLFRQKKRCTRRCCPKNSWSKLSSKPSLEAILFIISHARACEKNVGPKFASRVQSDSGSNLSKVQTLLHTPNLSSGKKGESCYLLLEAVSYLQTKRNSIRRIPCRENMSRLYRYSMIFQSLGTYRPSDFAEILWMSFFLTLQQAKNFRRFAFLFLKLFLSSLCCVVICSIESPSRLRDNFRCFSKRPRFSSPKKTSFSPINLCSNFEGQPATNVAHRGKRFARFDSGE